MNNYEAILILKPQLSDVEVEAFLEKCVQKITGSGGTIEKSLKMGRRKLPFRFKRFKNSQDGIYAHLLFQAPALFPKELQASLKISDEVMRTLITRFDPTINTIAKPVPKKVFPTGGGPTAERAGSAPRPFIKTQRTYG